MSNFDSTQIDQALSHLRAKDYVAAFNLLAPMADAGDPRAMCNLATLYQCGLGVSVDGIKAVELYLKVAEQNIRKDCLSGVAYNNLATIYGMGIPGVDRDPDKAQKYRGLAKNLGFDM
jgi:TPR repeat protein